MTHEKGKRKSQADSSLELLENNQFGVKCRFIEEISTEIKIQK